MNIQTERALIPADFQATQREILLDVRTEPLTSIDALVEHCHRALSAQLWTTCCWPDGSSWKIGDFNYLVVSVAPDTDARLYVQFWSEPGERVLLEVGSGEWCPGAIRYIGPAQRKALEARGFALGGRARNYAKELAIALAATSEAASLEVLQILFEVFGYRGQWRLEVERHRGERADHGLVYTSVTPDDFAKIATHAGFRATVATGGDTPVVTMTRRRREFRALMDWRVPGQNLYALVALQADLTLKDPVPDEAIARINSMFQFVKVWRTDQRTVRMHMPLMLKGGVTAAWLAQSLEHWLTSWRKCELELRRAAAPTRHQQTSQRSELVH